MTAAPPPIDVHVKHTHRLHEPVALDVPAPEATSARPALCLVDLPTTRYLVLSPHLDDAVLSCGGLLVSLQGRRSVTVVTFFTEAPEPYTMSARAYLRYCKYPRRGDELFRQRREEDARVLESIDAKWVHVGLADALFRKRPVGRVAKTRARPLQIWAHVYPTYRFHIAAGRVSKHDRELQHRVEATVADMASRGPTLVLAPLGIGRHVDHLIVRDAALASGADVMYYADIPYALRCSPDVDFVQRHGLVRASLVSDPAAKRLMIEGYGSQARALFPTGIPDLVDDFYVPRTLLRRP